MATSSVPAVKAAILTLLQADAGLTGVDVRWAEPIKDLPPEMVSLGNAEFTAETVPFLKPAPHRHREDYVIPVWVGVELEGDDPRTTETRMWEITGVVENLLRNNVNLQQSLGLLHWAIVAGKEPVLGPGDGKWIAANRINVQVKADI